MAAANLGDFFMFDLARLEWTDVGRGDPTVPSSRDSFGFAGVGEALFIFGGSSINTGYRGDLMVLYSPKDVAWPRSSRPGYFIEIYDWDMLVLHDQGMHGLTVPVFLCTGCYPCAISVVGDGRGSISRAGNGSIICMDSLGCTGVAIASSHILCGRALSDNPVVEVEGASLSIEGSSFLDCVSSADGGCIRAFGLSDVSITRTRFVNSRIMGMGGAVSIRGGTLQITPSLFQNCSAQLGGGAVAAADYACYGRRQAQSTQVRIDA